MNVFVAGGTGFLGKRVVHFLEKEGHKVIVYHRGLRAVPTRADVIVNCVGIIKEWNQTFEEAHVEMTEWLLGLANKLDVGQFVQVSAIGVRSDGTMYQRTKRRAEKLVENSGLNYAILRPGFMWGPDDKSINVFRSLSRTGFCPLFSNASIQPVHVDTVAQVIVAACNRQIRNRTVEVAGPEILTYREVFDRIHRGVRPVKIPRLLQKIMTSFWWLSQTMPTEEMLEMMRHDTTTNDTTIEKLNIRNPKLK